MLPITSGIKTTKLNILIYSIILLPIAVAPSILNYSGFLYLTFAITLSTYYIFISYKLFQAKNPIKEKKLATKLFGYSIFYLFMIFTFVLIDKFI